MPSHSGQSTFVPLHPCFSIGLYLYDESGGYDLLRTADHHTAVDTAAAAVLTTPTVPRRKAVLAVQVLLVAARRRALAAAPIAREREREVPLFRLCHARVLQRSLHGAA